jgi:endonuclease/exonuclease/phosphatase family metal-dependent hydrolase
MAECDVIFVVLYLVTGLGLQGENLTILAEVAGYVRTQGKPYIIAGDWNMETNEVAASGIQLYLHGVFRSARGPAPGGARTIDFCLVSEALGRTLELSWDPWSPWASPHTGVSGVLH